MNGKLLSNGELDLVLYDKLEGWGGAWGGRDAQEGGYTYILTVR